MVFAPRISLILSGLLLKGMLEYSYLSFVYPYYDYMAFDKAIAFWPYVYSIVLTLACLSVLPSSIEKPSEFLKTFLFIIPILPMIVLMAIGGQSIVLCSVSVLFYALIAIPFKSMPLGLPRMKDGVMIVAIAAILCGAAVTIWKVKSGAFDYATLDFSEVYSLRAILSEETEPSWVIYLTAWTVAVLNIFLIAQALLSGRIMFLGLVILFQVLLFSVTGHKSVLAYMFMVVVLRVYMTRIPNAKDILNGVTGIIVFSLIVWGLLELLMVPSILIRRLLFVPAQVNYLYYETFLSLDAVIYSNGFLGSFLRYPFSEPVPYMVSQFAFGHSDTWVNSGFIGAGYMQLGWLGIAIYSLLLKFLLWLADELGKELPTWYATALVAAPFLIAFTSSDLPTTLLTHGLMLALFILWIAGGREGQGLATMTEEDSAA